MFANLKIIYFSYSVSNFQWSLVMQYVLTSPLHYITLFPHKLCVRVACGKACIFTPGCGSAMTEKTLNDQVWLLTGLHQCTWVNCLYHTSQGEILDPLTSYFFCQPSYQTKTYGYRTFSISAPRMWNKLPMDIKCSSSIAIFKQKLKAHLFKLAYY